MSDKSKIMELKMLRDKCLLFNQFMSEKGGLPAQLAEAYKESNKLIKFAYSERNIKPLRSMCADIDDQINRHMPLTMAQEIKNIFKDNFHIDYTTSDKAKMKTVEKLLKKGEITRPDEYELLINRIDEIYEDPNSKGEIKRINELLKVYYLKYPSPKY